MRSPIGPILVIVSLATALGLAVVIVQTAGLRGQLDETRQEVVSLREQVETMERGVPMSKLSMRLAELENDIREWVVAFSSDVAPGDPSSTGGSASSEQVLDRLNEVLDRIEALDRRLDEICEGVPVC
jgi:phage shock protein A